MENEKRNFMFKLKRFIKECARVLKVTKKPSNMEYKTIVKVSAIGMLVIGFLGFLVLLIFRFIVNGG
ncbi:MAG: protein translocase SEC61 complex subunit gamma [Nanoarchaeota archaeon]|nr:protein translocase SEC61 complex subunit gamma [Nanoarchaeota archaeon]